MPSEKAGIIAGGPPRFVQDFLRDGRSGILNGITERGHEKARTALTDGKVGKGRLLMRRKRKAVILVASFLVLAGVLSGVFYLWLKITDRTFVWTSSYRASVSGRPDVRARLYTLPEGERLILDRPCVLPPRRHLLVLASRASGDCEGYYIDLKAQRIGIPGFSPPMFIPLFHSALTYDAALDGYGGEGALAADWDVKDGGKEVHIRIKGYKYVATMKYLSIDPEEYARKTIALGYQNEIILHE